MGVHLYGIFDLNLILYTNDRKVVSEVLLQPLEEIFGSF